MKERKGECEQGRGRERGRERERERERERIPSRLHPVSAEPDAGLELTNPWDHDRSRNPELDASPTEPPGRLCVYISV